MKTQMKYALAFIAGAKAFDIGGLIGGAVGNLAGNLAGGLGGIG